MFRFKIIFFVSVCCLFVACEEEISPPCELPPPDWFGIDLQDTQGNSLFGSVYPADSIKLFRAQDTIATFVRDPSILVIGFEQVESNEPYFLRLSETDTDTLWMQWKVMFDLCKQYSLDSLRYNGESVSDLRGNVVLVKD